MDLRPRAWKRVWKIAFFGLKYGHDLENRAAHPYQTFPEIQVVVNGALFLYYLAFLFYLAYFYQTNSEQMF